MRVTRLTMSDGSTSIGDVELPGEASGPRWVSDRIDVTAMRVRRLDETLEQPLHPAPRRQIGVVLTGRMEVESAAGDRREFPPGSIVFLEDTEGTGHITRALEAPTLYLEIHLAPEAG